MTKSIQRVFVHMVWSTKNRAPLIEESDDPLIERIIASQCLRLGWQPIAVGCARDHVHVLCRVGVREPLVAVIRAIKSASAVLVNRERPSAKLLWQEGYAALSIDPTNVKSVGLYVHEQRRHHQRRQLDEDLERVGSD
jgi:putative transposase